MIGQFYQVNYFAQSQVVDRFFKINIDNNGKLDISKAFYMIQGLKEPVDIHNPKPRDYTNDKDKQEYYDALFKILKGPYTIPGAQGDNNYYVDQKGIVLRNEIDSGLDTVFSSINGDLTQTSGIENLVLQNWNDPTKIELYPIGTSLIYGHPTNILLDYWQGNEFRHPDNNKYMFKGTCTWTALANLLKMNGLSITEKDMVKIAYDNGFCLSDPNVAKGIVALKNILNPNVNLDQAVESLLGSSYSIVDTLEISNIVFSFNLPSSIYHLQLDIKTIEEKIKAGHGVQIQLNNKLLEDTKINKISSFLYDADHSINLTGVVYDEYKNLKGFYVNNSNSGIPRIVSVDRLQYAYSHTNVTSRHYLVTDKPLNSKIWSNNITGTGNDLPNLIVGTSQTHDKDTAENKELLQGNNKLEGQEGNDIYIPGTGIDTIEDSSGFDWYIIENTSGKSNINYIYDESPADKPEIGPSKGRIFFTSENVEKVTNNFQNLAVIRSGLQKELLRGSTKVLYTEASTGRDVYEDAFNPSILYYWNGNDGSELTIVQGKNYIIIPNFNNEDFDINLTKKEEDDTIALGDIELEPRLSEIEVRFDAYEADYEPLVLDLNGNGLTTSSVEEGIYLDMKDDGFAELTAWAGDGDGVLVLDLNENGIIDSGKEVFGDNMELLAGGTAQHSFEALAQYDSNNDFVIDSQDDIFSSLRVVKNHGEISNEILYTLEEVGVESINLNYTDVDFTDENGNSRIFESTITMANGDENQVGAYLLDSFTATTLEPELLEVPDEIAALPNYKNSGTVYSLHQAMVRDTTGNMQTLVENFIAETSVEQRDVIIDDLLMIWTDSSGIAPGSGYDAQKLNIITAFLGDDLPENLTDHIDLLNSLYDTVHNEVYSTLLSQSHLKDTFDLITHEFDKDIYQESYDFSAVATTIIDLINTDPVAGQELFDEFARASYYLGYHWKYGYEEFYATFKALDDSYALALDMVGNNYFKVDPFTNRAEDTRLNDFIDGDDNRNGMSGDRGNDIIRGYGGDDVTLGGCQGDDRIYGGDGVDHLEGASGNDTINGGSGNDYILAGTGNDTLTDISGSDLYTFSQGDGLDVITDLDFTLEDIDTIDFAEGIDKEDIAVFMDNNDLVIGYGPDDQIVVKNQAEEVYGVEMLQLADGDFITAEDINMIIQEMTAFANTEGFAITSVEQVQANPDLMNIVINGWS